SAAARALPADSLNQLADKLFSQLANAYKKKILGRTTGLTNASFPEEGNFRDSLMADNVVWLNRVRFPGSKIVVWAHDEHVSKSINRERMNYFFRRNRSMGQYLEGKYRNQYKAFAFLTATGKTTGFTASAHPVVYAIE